ncbi:MAG: hypothetical protein QXL58_04970 [Candidatus Hadarchaeales archaeon]
MLGRFSVPVKHPRGTPISENTIPVRGEIAERERAQDENRVFSEYGEELQKIWERTWEEMREWGIEALAFYAPYHFYGTNWGIYFYEDRLLSFAYHLWKKCGGPFGESFILAFKFVHKHELFHFNLEFLSTVGEEITGKNIYRKNNSDPSLSWKKHWLKPTV